MYNKAVFLRESETSLHDDFHDDASVTGLHTARMSYIFVEGLCIISVKELNYEKSRFYPSLLIYCKLTHDVTG